MPAPPIEEILVVDPRIEQLLGRSAAEIYKMTLRELSDAAFEKGFTWRIGREGVVKGLTIRVADDDDGAAAVVT